MGKITALRKLSEEMKYSPHAVIVQSQMDDIRKEYDGRFKQRGDKKGYYVIIARKQITASTEERLVDKLRIKKYGLTYNNIQSLFPCFLAWKKDYTSCSSLTIRSYLTSWNNIISKSPIVDMPLEKLEPIHFMAFFRLITKEGTMPKKRFINIKSVLNSLYDYLIESGIVTHNPVKECNYRTLQFKPVYNKDKVFTIKERNALILSMKEYPDDIYKLAIELAFCLVIRIGELQALKWDDIIEDYIHIQRQYISEYDIDEHLNTSSKYNTNVDYLKGKTDKGFRKQYLVPKAREILERIKIINPHGEYILMDSKDNNQLIAEKFNTKLKYFFRQAGIREFSSHKIRFSNASILFHEGMPLTELQNMLGHTDIAMTIYYLRNVAQENISVDILKKGLG